MWLNGERRGVMVPSGLVGPLRWTVDLYDASVAIDGPSDGPKPPPPAVTQNFKKFKKKTGRGGGSGPTRGVIPMRLHGTE